MDRAPDFESGGWGFESLRGAQTLFPRYDAFPDPPWMLIGPLPRFCHSAAGVCPRGTGTFGIDRTLVRLNEARAMSLYERKSSDSGRIDPAMLATFLIGIVAAAVLATAF